MLYEVDSTFNDSTIYKERPIYLASTLDSLQNFTLQNLKAGTYQLVGLKDRNTNLKYDPRLDDISFIGAPITLPTDSLYVLNMYEPIPAPEITRIFQRSARSVGVGYLGALDSMKVRPVNEEITNFRTIRPEPRDTLQFWYDIVPRPDSIGLQASIGDSLYTVYTRLTDQERDSLRLDKIEGFDFRQPAAFQVNTPIAQIADSLIQVLDRDSLQIAITADVDKLKNKFDILFEKEENQRYQLLMLPGAITDMYGEQNDTIRQTYTTSSLRDYGNLGITIKGSVDVPMVLQIVDKDLKLIAEAIVSTEGRYAFDHLKPGKYRFRLIYDTNKNRQYDPGNWELKIQPERVVYYPEIIQLNKNWDVEESFTLD